MSNDGKFISESQDEANATVVPAFDTIDGLNREAPMPDVMIDIETMSTRPDAAIVSIGAVAFDMRKLVMGERFYTNVDLVSAQAAGGHIDAGTVLWWLRQGDNARSAFSRNAKPIGEALDALTEFLISCAPLAAVRPWGNGVDFDMVILTSAYRAAGRETPWKYWNQRDARTLFSMYPSVEKDPMTTTVHNALDDAEAAVRHVFKIRKSIAARKAAA